MVFYEIAPERDRDTECHTTAELPKCFDRDEYKVSPFIAEFQLKYLKQVRNH